jgi:hypothetical protein
MARLTIPFGKIDYNGSGRKNCLVTLEVELKDNDNKPVFSVCGNIWNPRGTDIYSGGQNLDEIREYIHSPLFDKIYRLWKLYHLNDMNAGTLAQDEALNNYCRGGGGRRDYNEACDYLKSVNLYNDNGYLYGHSWLYREIPEEDLNEIKSILNI